MFTGLVRINQGGQTEPAIAESWDISADGKTYIFQLRKDVRWSDGSFITAHDFVRSFERLKAPETGSSQAALYKDIIGFGATSKQPLGVTAVNDYTLSIKLSNPFPYLLHILARPAAAPFSINAFQKYGDNWAHYISSGAYILDKIEADERVILKKNPLYFEAEQVAIDKIQYVKLDNLNTGLRIVTSGRADISHSLDERQLEAARNSPQHTLHSRPTTSLVFLQLNPTDPGLQDIRVRQALYLATDTARLLKANNLPYTQIDGLIPPLADYESTIKKPGTAMSRLKQAQGLMKRAGYSADNLLPLTLKTGDYIQNNVAISIQRQWRNIYVDLTLEIMPYSQLKQQVNSGDFQIMRRGWRLNFPDPTGFLRIYSHEYNMQLYKEVDPKLQAYFKDIYTFPEKRDQLVNAAENYLLSKYPSIPIYSKPEHILVSNLVYGWIPKLGVSNQSRWLRLNP